jgi:DNA-binding beta-propeller fold protein YncE
MRNDCVYVYSVSNDTLLTRIPVGKKPNTIALGPDERYLYVSCRGPNAKTSYLDRSPEDGELYMIRCDDFTTIDVRKLGNQPTALAVHPSGEYLAVSNFRDNTIEIYRIDYRYESLARHILL